MTISTDWGDHKMKGKIGILAVLLAFILIVPSVIAFSSSTEGRIGSIEPNAGNSSSSIIEQTMKNEIDQLTPINGKLALDLSSSNYFTENKGQWAEEMDFLAKTSFGAAEFNSKGFYYALSPSDKDVRDVVSFQFIGSKSIVPIGCSSIYTSNYFLSNDSTQWHAGVNNYAEIV